MQVAHPGTERRHETAANPLDAARQGDLNAFGELLRTHERMVYNLALRIVRDRGAAEDLAQDTFLQLHQHLGRIESEAHLRRWLRKTVTHRAIDHTRRAAHRPEAALDEATLVLGVVGREPDPWLAAALRALVADLPPRPRAVVVLRFQEDLDVGEIAATLDLPVNTVKSHLRRALLVLRTRAARLKDGRS